MLITAIITILGVSALTVLWKQRFRFVLAHKEYCMTIIMAATTFVFACYVSIDIVEGRILCMILAVTYWLYVHAIWRTKNAKQS